MEEQAQKLNLRASIYFSDKLDGSLHSIKLDQIPNFSNFRIAAHKYAARRGLKAQTFTCDGAFFFRFVSADTK